MFEPMTHAKVPHATTQVHAGHPFRHKINHDRLLQYVQQRLQQGKQARDNRLDRMAQMDRDVAGWLAMSPEDRQRMRKKESDGTPQAITMNLPVSFIHLDDMMTYFTTTFSPNRGMFYHTGKPDEVGPANQIITLMNNHAIYAGYFRQVTLTTWSLLKYNLGGFYGFWSRDFGPKMQTTEGQTTVADELKWQGNKLESLDMYNTFWDPSVHPTALHKEGEWCARAYVKSHYWLAEKAARGVYHNVSDLLDEGNGIAECQYYRHPPSEARLNEGDGGRDSGQDYASWFGAPDFVASNGYELTEVFIRLNPLDFALIEGGKRANALRNRYEIWRVTVCNNQRIIDVEHMNNIHGMLPMMLGVINDDLMGQSQKSVGEILTPLQDFASFLLNIHVLANRKNVWGNTYYDPTVIDMSQVQEGAVASRIPISPQGYGKDIRNAIFHDSHTLDTKQTLGDLQGVMDLINQFFPTQSLPSQIASIDRATTNQVAAVQQGANRRMHKTARLLDDTLFRNMRFMFYYNIIQYQPDGADVQDFYGRAVKIDLTELRATDLPFIIGQGLKSLDRQAAAEALQQIIFALIQNPQAAQRIDLIALVDYWTSMIDVDVDMTKFRLEQGQPTQTGPEGQTANATPEEAAAGLPAGASVSEDQVV